MPGTETAVRPATEGVAGETQQLSFPVTGMTCAACASRVQRKLARGAGVTDAAVNFATERATVTYDGTATDAARLIELVRDAGYGARTETVSLPVRGLEYAVSGEPLERELRALRGVIGASVNLATGEARVELLPEVVTAAGDLSRGGGARGLPPWRSRSRSRTRWNGSGWCGSGSTVRC
jgi:P-type Cu+ transporter